MIATNARDHQDVSIGIFLFCIMLDGTGWYLKIWESCEALVGYALVLVRSKEVTHGKL